MEQDKFWKHVNKKEQMKFYPVTDIYGACTPIVKSFGVIE